VLYIAGSCCTLLWTVVVVNAVSLLQCYTFKKKPHLNNLERFYIRKKATYDNQLNNKHIIFPNIIFDTIHKSEIP